MKMKLTITILLLLAGTAQGQLVFQVGNLNSPVPPAVPDLHMGLESYAYLIYPPDQASCPLGGFKLEAVHMYLEFTASQVPADFQVAGALLGAFWDPSMNMFLPEGPLCEGPVIDYHITEPGLYEIILPMDSTCGCLPFDEHYFLTVNYLTPFEADLPIDNQPEAGVVFNNDGGGWIDMIVFDKTAGGKVIIWGDLVCCDPAIGNEQNTWSEIKGLYR